MKLILLLVALSIIACVAESDEINNEHHFVLDKYGQKPIGMICNDKRVKAVAKPRFIFWLLGYWIGSWFRKRSFLEAHIIDNEDPRQTVTRKINERITHLGKKREQLSLTIHELYESYEGQEYKKAHEKNEKKIANNDKTFKGKNPSLILLKNLSKQCSKYEAYGIASNRFKDGLDGKGPYAKKVQDMIDDERKSRSKRN